MTAYEKKWQQVMHLGTVLALIVAGLSVFGTVWYLMTRATALVETPAQVSELRKDLAEHARVNETEKDAQREAIWRVERRALRAEMYSKAMLEAMHAPVPYVADPPKVTASESR